MIGSLPPPPAWSLDTDIADYGVILPIYLAAGAADQVMAAGAASSNPPAAAAAAPLAVAMEGVQRSVIERNSDSSAQSRLTSNNNVNNSNYSGKNSVAAGSDQKSSVVSSSTAASAAAPTTTTTAGMDGLQSSGPPPFLTKTYDMVDDSSTDGVVSWGSNNNSFVVWLPADFARDLLPKFFKHSNFSSFVRQLNTYGFRKVDPDRWEFANEGFLRGQRHLLKNIHRRKPVSHHHTPQQQQQTQPSSSGSCVEVGKYGVEGEVDMLKRDKNVLMLELVRLKQQLHLMSQRLEATESSSYVMGQRLEATEKTQQQMMAFLAKAIQDPTFLPRLVQSSENSKRLATDRKRRRLPKTEIEVESGAVEFDGQIVKYQPAQSEATRAKVGQFLTKNDLSSMMDTGSPFVEALLANLGTTLVDDAEESDLSNRQSGVTLTEMQVVCPPDSVAMPMDDFASEQSPIRSVDEASMRGIQIDDEIDDCDLPELQPTESTIEVGAPLPGSSTENEGLGVSEAEPRTEPKSTMGPSGTNDVFWEQFLTANPESPGTDSEEADTVESVETDNTNWWDSTKPSVDRLAEQMGQLAPGIKQ